MQYVYILYLTLTWVCDGSSQNIGEKRHRMEEGSLECIQSWTFLERLHVLVENILFLGRRKEAGWAETLQIRV